MRQIRQEIDKEIHALCDALVGSEGRLEPMKTEDRRVCPSCGNEFSGAMEFCPVCMLRKALARADRIRRVFCQDQTAQRQHPRAYRIDSSIMN